MTTSQLASAYHRKCLARLATEALGRVLADSGE